MAPLGELFACPELSSPCGAISKGLPMGAAMAPLFFSVWLRSLRSQSRSEAKALLNHKAEAEALTFWKHKAEAEALTFLKHTS